jgi:phosphoribosyl 1,2-cyclic phosphate phosphodiesterase
MHNRTKIKFTILGSGTSSGIPTIGCRCDTCTSDDPRDKRLRTSLLIESETTTIVIDTTPDFRQQMLRADVRKLDAVLYTHQHFDHIGGFDDLRAFNYIARKPMPIYLSEDTFLRLKRTFYYAFEEPEQIGGGVPIVDVNIIDTHQIRIGDIDIQPIPLLHGKLNVLGFRIGNFAYCTDTNHIPQESLKYLLNLDFLIIDALRFVPHSTHYSKDEAIEVIEMIKPKKAYLIHMAHQLKHSECERSLPANINLTYDGLEIVTE